VNGPSTSTSAANRDRWDRTSEPYQTKHGPQLDTLPLSWGVWAIPESDVHALGDVAGAILLDLGCGGGQWSASLVDVGAHPVGLDLSERQLGAARRLMRTPYPLVHADGERLPFASGAFDVVLSDHGAMSWADPYRTVPEVARVLRQGGRFAFNASTPWITACESLDDGMPSTTLRGDYFNLHRVNEDGGGTTFVLGYGDWIRLFRQNGLAVEDLIELQAPEDALTTYDDYVAEWARRWPAEAIWVTTRS
jgi:SAM-dependent methyltransferase